MMSLVYNKLEDVLVMVLSEDYIQDVLVLDVLDPVCMYTLISTEIILSVIINNTDTF